MTTSALRKEINSFFLPILIEYGQVQDSEIDFASEAQNEIQIMYQVETKEPHAATRPYFCLSYAAFPQETWRKIFNNASSMTIFRDEIYKAINAYLRGETIAEKSTFFLSPHLSEEAESLSQA